MPIRDNVRERRRERIEQLIGQQTTDIAKKTETPPILVDEQLSSWPDPVIPEPIQADILVATATPRPREVPPQSAEPPRGARTDREGTRFDASPKYPASDAPMTPADIDPELWWKERERRIKSGQSAGWQGLTGIAPASSGRTELSPPAFEWNKLFGGFALRLFVSALLFGGIWGWLKMEMPGSAQARAWAVSSVSRDMDFEAVEAWYGDTFGGSPSFFPFHRQEPDTKEVSALLSPADTAIPVLGQIVQSYAENGKGVKVAASGGKEVYAIYTGRVQQVTTDPDSGVTILVQHQNRILTVYGNLATAKVKPNDWVETGQQLGQLGATGDGQSQAVLYFSVQQNGKTINPADVVTFD